MSISISRQGSQGPTGPAGQSNSVFSYLAETGATSGYPGDGAILWNNATQTSATTIVVAHIDANGTDQGSILEVLTTVSKFRLQHDVNNAHFQEWTITGTPTLIDAETSTERWLIPVSLSAGSYSFAAGETILLILAAGIQGATGPTGTNGVDGKTVLNGTSAPNFSIGSNGDFYLDTNTTTLYGPKTAGSWPGGVSLVGPQGPAGANGTNGANGSSSTPDIYTSSNASAPIRSTYNHFRVRILGAGGGGGGGSTAGPSNVANGGGGGGGGAYSEVTGATADLLALGASLNVTVGSAGSGGANVATNNTSGTNGSTAGTSSVVCGSTTICEARGGVRGLGGVTAGAGGAGGEPGGAGGAGGGAAAGSAGSTAASPGHAAGGAGGGGGVNAANAAQTGGAGASRASASGVSLGAGTAGAATGAAGGAGGTGLVYTSGGGGGGGGGGNAAGNGGAGGAGGAGAGGGGGGGCRNGSTSGAGGNGGAGWVVITWW